jgi:hypothetical protein
MNDSLLSLTLIFAELGAVLLLVMIVLIIRYLIGSKNEVKTTRALVKHIKSMIPAHRDQLVSFFKDKLEKNKRDFNIETLIKDERKIYDRLIKVSLTKDTNLLKLTTDDINSLINDYVRLLSLKAEKESSAEKESRDLTLRKENEALRLENSSLVTRLTISEETIENMMSEFSSMYEGGKKEGEQRLKNEMYQLKQSLDSEEAKVKAELDKIDNQENE